MLFLLNWLFSIVGYDRRFISFRIKSRLDTSWQSDNSYACYLTDLSSSSSPSDEFWFSLRIAYSRVIDHRSNACPWPFSPVKNRPSYFQIVRTAVCRCWFAHTCTRNDAHGAFEQTIIIVTSISGKWQEPVTVPCVRLSTRSKLYLLQGNVYVCVCARVCVCAHVNVIHFGVIPVYVNLNRIHESAVI